MANKLKILHLEDLPSDAALVERQLKKGNIFFEKIVVDNRKDFENALKEFSPDIILSDHSLPSFNSIEALQIVKDSGKSIPVILITATVSEDFAVSVLKKGAEDYILKDNMGRLPTAIEHAIEKYEAFKAKLTAEKELQSAHARLLFHLENSPLGYVEWSKVLKVKAWSKRVEEIFGWTLEEFNAQQMMGFNQVYIEDQAWVMAIAERMLNGTMERSNMEYRSYTKDGRVVWCEWYNSVLKNQEGKVVTIMSLVQDITERKEAEKQLINNEVRFREFFETAPEALLVIDPVSGLFTDYNDNALKLLQSSGEELLTRSPIDISPAIQPDGKRSDEQLNIFLRLATDEVRPVFDWVICDSKGKNIFCEVRLNLLTNAGQPQIRASILDITERVELERRLLEEKIKKQQEITEAVLIAQEQERTFLGEELHDNINQILAASKLYIDYSMKTGEIRRDLVISGRDYIVTAMEEIRKLSKSLLPPSLGEVSMLEAINDLIENIQQANTLIFTRDWNDIDEKALSDKLKLSIFRIVQEQLNNVIKHARAKTVHIGFRQQPGILQMTIKDDGVGFDTSVKRKGVGLKNIASRTGFFNGDVMILSKPGAGCELSVKFDTAVVDE